MQFPLYDPMLIGTEQPPFDDDAYIYEIKMDGVRCLAYLYKDHVELINKRHLKLNSKFFKMEKVIFSPFKEELLQVILFVYVNIVKSFLLSSLLLIF